MAAAIAPRGAAVIAWSYAMICIAAIVVLLRFYVRAKMIHIVGREDIMIALSLISSLIMSIFMHRQVSLGGLGQHFATLTPTQIYLFSKAAYVAIIVYNFSLCATKFSILFFYLRIFSVKRWRKVFYAVVCILVLYTIWVAINSIWPCFPIRAQWDKTVDGWCFPSLKMWYLNAALNLVTDVIVVTLPIPALASLQLPRKQKIGVTLIFALGFFVCIISILRLPSIAKAGKSTDPTFDNWGIAIWSIVEVNAAIVGACLPTLKPLVGLVFPNLFSSIHTDPHAYYQHSKGADRTATNTYGGGAGTPATVGTKADYSSTKNVLSDEDDVELTELEVRTATGHVEGVDDTRSEVTTERSMDGWRRVEDTV